MKYEVKLFVQTTEIYIVEADTQDAAEDAAVARALDDFRAQQTETVLSQTDPRAVS